MSWRERKTDKEFINVKIMSDNYVASLSPEVFIFLEGSHQVYSYRVLLIGKVWTVRTGTLLTTFCC